MNIAWWHKFSAPTALQAPDLLIGDVREFFRGLR